MSEKEEIVKMQKQELEDYSNVLFDFCKKEPAKIELHFSLIISTLIHEDNSIEKKSLALKIIEKLIANTTINS